MLILPEYNVNIIVGVMYNSQFTWYVTEKSIWHMDFKKKYETIKKKYDELGRTNKRFLYEVGDFETFCSLRFGIPVLDETSVSVFLKRISKFIVNKNELEEAFNQSEDKSDYWPALYVNFDSKILYSNYPEIEDYEYCVPGNWTGLYMNFMDRIPYKNVYWTVS